MADGVKLSELVAAISRRGATLPSETALFIVLECAEALRDAPSRVSTETVRINADGALTLDRVGGETAEPAAIDSLAALAVTMLSPLPANVRAMADRVRGREIRTLAAFRAEIEALLVPLNRAAARRVLGRVVREHQRGSAGAAISIERGPSDAPSALATDPSAPPATVADALDTNPDSVPPFPPPPRLGNLASLPSGASPLHAEPEIIDEPPPRRAAEPFPVMAPREPTALDTEPGIPDALATTPDRELPAPTRSRWPTALLLVLAAAAAFAVWHWYVAPETPQIPHSRPR